MEQIKAAMLTWYAKGFDLEVEVFYHDFFTYHVVETDESNGYELVHRLALRGCADIHVHSTDETTLGLLEEQLGKLFRFCRSNFKSVGKKECECAMADSEIIG